MASGQKIGSLAFKNFSSHCGSHSLPVSGYKCINTHQTLRSGPHVSFFSHSAQQFSTKISIHSKREPLIPKKTHSFPSIFFGTEHSWSLGFVTLCRQLITDNPCWQRTADAKDKRLHCADEDTPSGPPSFQAIFRQQRVSPSYNSLFLSLLLYQSPVSEPSVPDSLCTICCVHMRFAGSSLSTAEQQGDWSSLSGNRERSPVSEKCKYSAIQQQQSRRDGDENNSFYTAQTGRDCGGQRG